MCKWTIPLQYAYIFPNAPPERQFKRLETPVISDAHLKAVRGMCNHTGEYISVYGWKNWKGGKITPEISKTAIIDGVFFDFDDADNPLAAIRDAAEVAWYVGHATTNFSGAKGAHVLIHCHPVDLIPDLKSAVLRRFANMLGDGLPELSTMDWSVIGDTSRVHRIIDSVHPGTKLHAIGLTTEELATLTIDEIHEMAANRRGLIQVPEPSQWVTDELYRIEEEIISNRFEKVYTVINMPPATRRYFIEQHTSEDRLYTYSRLCAIEDEVHRIKRASIPPMSVTSGATAEETWLIHAVKKFKATGRAATGNRRSEHTARVHLAKLADECGWTVGEICDIYTGADDYDRTITERMVRSCIGTHR